MLKSLLSFLLFAFVFAFICCSHIDQTTCKQYVSAVSTIASILCSYLQDTVAHPAYSIKEKDSLYYYSLLTYGLSTRRLITTDFLRYFSMHLDSNSAIKKNEYIDKIDSVVANWKQY